MRFLAYIIISATLFSACKKYPEGGRVNRLFGTEGAIAGPRFVTAFLVNGLDSSSAFRNLLVASCPSSSFHFLFENESSSEYNVISSGCIPYPGNNWYVTGDRKHVVITTQATPGAGSYYPFLMNKDFSMSWRIEKLTRDDLWLNTTFNGRNYSLKTRYYH